MQTLGPKPQAAAPPADSCRPGAAGAKVRRARAGSPREASAAKTRFSGPQAPVDPAYAAGEKLFMAKAASAPLAHAVTRPRA